MRKIILALGISVDGYIARLDGTFDFLFMPKDFSMAWCPCCWVKVCRFFPATFLSAISH